MRARPSSASSLPRPAVDPRPPSARSRSLLSLGPPAALALPGLPSSTCQTCPARFCTGRTRTARHTIRSTGSTTCSVAPGTQPAVLVAPSTQPVVPGTPFAAPAYDSPALPVCSGASLSPSRERTCCPTALAPRAHGSPRHCSRRPGTCMLAYHLKNGRRA